VNSINTVVRPHAGDAPGQVLRRHGIYILVAKDGARRVYRFLCDDGAYVWMMEIGQRINHGVKFHVPPKNTRLRVRWKATDVEQLLMSGLLYLASGFGIPHQMPVEPIPLGVDPTLDKKRLLVSTIFRYWGYRVVTDPVAYAKATREACNFYGVATSTGRAWLEAHLFYGEHPNATMSQTWRRGSRVKTHVYGND
jgi:hypothetical protein